MNDQDEQVLSDTEFKAQIKDLLTKVEMGNAVGSFINGPVGRLLTERIEQASIDICQKLKEVDPHDAKLIMRLQNRAKVYDTFWLILLEVLHVGEQASKDLDAPPE